jgi:hypothetical protein
MSSETSSATVASTGNGSWLGGVVGGIAGGAVMAVLISLMNPPTLAVAIPGLYTLTPPANGVAGWVVHLSHSAIFGVIFAAVMTAPAVESYADDLLPALGIGVAYGVVIWVVAAALLMPVWLGAVGFPSPPPFPNFAVPSLLWHVVFGGVLGAAYPFVRSL